MSDILSKRCSSCSSIPSATSIDHEAMKQALLMLLLQLHRQSVQSNSKLKLRMEFIAAATFVGSVNETELKQTLLMLTEKFEFHQNYTRMALLDYDNAVVQRTELTSSQDKLVRTINDITNRGEYHRSVLRKALEEMLEIAVNKSRTNALKVFLVITHKWPTAADSTEYEYEEAVPISKKINANGLFFIVYNYQEFPEQKVRDYFAVLCGQENLVEVNELEGVNEAFEEKIISKILNRACERRERFCYFVDSSLRICRSVWYYSDGFLPDADCHTVRNGSNPDECHIAECYQHCDYHWPWLYDAYSCGCVYQNSRRGGVPFTKLQYCPQVKECEPCKYGSASANPQESNTADGMSPEKGLRLDAWAIIVIGAVGLAAMGVLLFVAIRLSKKITYSTFTNLPRTTTLGSKKVTKAKSPHYLSLSLNSKASDVNGCRRK